jgi:hypothetical protein
MLEAKKRFMANPKLLTESQRVKVSGDPNWHFLLAFW